MGSQEENGPPPPAFIVPLVLTCVWLLLLALQNAFVVRASREIMNAYGASALGGRPALELWLAVIGMFLAMIAVVALALVRKPWVIWLAVAAILYCHPIIGGLRAIIFPLAGIPIADLGWSYLLGLSTMLTIATVGYLMTAREVGERFGTTQRLNFLAPRLWQKLRGR